MISKSLTINNFQRLSPHLNDELPHRMPPYSIGLEGGFPAAQEAPPREGRIAYNGTRVYEPARRAQAVAPLSLSNRRDRRAGCRRPSDDRREERSVKPLLYAVRPSEGWGRARTAREGVSLSTMNPDSPRVICYPWKLWQCLTFDQGVGNQSVTDVEKHA